jgi:hypothetical protein
MSIHQLSCQQSTAMFLFPIAIILGSEPSHAKVYVIVGGCSILTVLVTVLCVCAVETLPRRNMGQSLRGSKT